MKWQDRIPFWRLISSRTGAQSYLDVGCGRGDNMLALRSINEDFELSGVDQNMPALLEAQSHSLDVDCGGIEELPYLLQPPGCEDRIEPLLMHGVCDLASLTASMALFDADGYARALTALDDASRQWVLLIDLNPLLSLKQLPIGVRALAKHAKRRLRLDQVGIAEGFGVPATFALMEKNR